MDRLIVRGAREHNLKDVSLDLPRDALIVFTGLSGSGKSSLAFDTIFAEGQRRYVESLSAYARQFLGQMDKPDVDFIEGLSPAVSIDQKSTSRNPRSTVGTITEVYDYLRPAVRPRRPAALPDLRRADQPADAAADRRPGARAATEGTRFQVLAPVVRGRKGEYAELFRELQTKGYSRARVDGATVSLAEPPKLDKKYKHSIDVVVDRLAVKPSAKRRLTDSVETALGLAGGLLLLDFVDLPEKAKDRERRFSEKLACPNDHPLSMDELEPRSFSFNSPFGACPECTGLGTRLEVDPELHRARRREVPRRRRGRAVGGRRVVQRVLPAAARGARRGPRASAWTRRGASCRPGPRRAVLHGLDYQVHVKYRNRYGRMRQLPHRLRGRDPVRPAPAQRDRVRLEPRALRGLHARGAVPGLPGLPAQARVARGAARRPVDRRRLPAADPRVRRRSCATSS